MELMCKPDEEPSVYIKEFMDELASTLEMWDECGVYGVKVEEIEHEERSGFIPFTNGGWDGIAYCNFQRGKDHFDALKKYSDNDFKDMIAGFREAMMEGWSAADFRQMPPKDTEQYAKLLEMTDEEFWDYFSEELQYNDENRELFSKSELGWQYTEPAAWKWRDGWEQEDDTVFFLKFRAVFYAADNHHGDTDEDEVYFYAAINTDFNYGRDYIPWLSCYGADPKCNKGEFSQTMKVSEMTREKVKEIFDKMEETLRNA